MTSLDEPKHRATRKTLSRQELIAHLSLVTVSFAAIVIYAIANH